MVVHTREGVKFQAALPALLSKRPGGVEDTHPVAGKLTTLDFFRDSACGVEKAAADSMPFDAVADAEHHRADGACVPAARSKDASLHTTRQHVLTQTSCSLGLATPEQVLLTPEHVQAWTPAR